MCTYTCKVLWCEYLSRFHYQRMQNTNRRVPESHRVSRIIDALHMKHWYRASLSHQSVMFPSWSFVFSVSVVLLDPFQQGRPTKVRRHYHLTKATAGAVLRISGGGFYSASHLPHKVTGVWLDSKTLDVCWCVCVWYFSGGDGCLGFSFCLSCMDAALIAPFTYVRA